MSNKNQDLVLHLKLDTIIPDSDSRRVRNALIESQYTVHGNPQVVPDEHFGSCFSFDGNDDFIELSPTSIPTGNEITVSFWVNGGNNLPNENFIVLAQTAKNSRVLYIHLPWTDKIIYFDCGGNPTDQDVDFDRISRSTDTDNSQDAVAYKGKWNHWAFTKDADKGEMKIYLNGVLWCHEEGKKQPILAAAKVCIANNYQGKIANFRIYKNVLSPEEIKMDMDDDLSAIAAFNLAYPLDFNLYEGENKESVIFIDDGTQGQELILEISNNSEQPLTLPALSGNASASNYHFELRFRPETLSATSLQQIVLKTTEGWSMSPPVTQVDDTVSLYFLASNNQVLGVNNPVSLTLQNINGAAGGGARTTRVELLCPQFAYQGEKVTNYYREKTLSIISHRGKKNIPLHVSFVESNRILNDGKTQNELILRIVNVLKDKSIPLIPASKGDEASKFIISFDVQENPKEEGQTQETIQKKDWALGTKSQVEGIEIKGKDFKMTKRHIEEWKIVKETKGVSPTWTITNQNEENVKLSPEWGLELTISNIISLHPSGQTNLYLRYENIPGYWDGTFVCTIEKTPILYKEGNVGIGTTSTPDNRLTVQGNTKLNGQLNVEGVFQLASCPMIRAIVGTEIPPNIKGDESIPTVTFVTEFIERILAQRLGGLIILLDRAVTADQSHPPYGYITGDKVNFGGFLLYESLDPSSVHSYGWGKPLMRLNPPPVKSVSGEIGIAGNPRTKPELSGTLMIDYQINELGELSLSRFVEVYFTGKAQIDMQQFSYQFRENL
jgi:hypothetical protein